MISGFTFSQFWERQWIPSASFWSPCYLSLGCQRERQLALSIFEVFFWVQFVYTLRDHFRRPWRLCLGLPRRRHRRILITTEQKATFLFGDARIYIESDYKRTFYLFFKWPFQIWSVTIFDSLKNDFFKWINYVFPQMKKKLSFVSFLVFFCFKRQKN